MDYRSAITLPGWLRKKKWFYHGTGNKRAADQILATCELRPSAVVKRGIMASMPGRVYLTDSLDYVSMFVFSTVSGSNCSVGSRNCRPKYGYLFAVDAVDLADVVLDEDWVGGLVAEGQYSKKYKWILALFNNLRNQHSKEFMSLLKRYKLSERKLLTGIEYHQSDVLSLVGRFMLLYVDDATMVRLFDVVKSDPDNEYTAIAHAGPVPITAAWYISKREELSLMSSSYKELDGFAERIQLSC